MPPVVLIVGCGVAGPVLGIFLKRKGYHPIVFEKVEKLGDAGATLLLMPNGLRVLEEIGIASKVKATSKPLEAFWEARSIGEVLGQSYLPSTFVERYGQPTTGIRRSSLNAMLKQMLLDSDIEVREGWKLVDIDEDDERVTAFFDGDRSIQGSFLIGADGIKAASRNVLLRKSGIEESVPDYTGLTQTAGISTTPESLQHAPALRNWYGDGVHVIAYPISSSQTSWAITQRESQEKEETWRSCGPEEMVEQRRRLSDVVSGWDPSILHLIEEPEKIIKFGLFDRKELPPSHWYSRRCVLAGDAAHPTSPHLGQGANQALEDCFHLCELLPSLADRHDAGLVGLELRERVFEPFARKRQPRTSILVQRARLQGESRVATGEDACRERNLAIAAAYQDEAALVSKYDDLLAWKLGGP